MWSPSGLANANIFIARQEIKIKNGTSHFMNIFQVIAFRNEKKYYLPLYCKYPGNNV